MYTKQVAKNMRLNIKILLLILICSCFTIQSFGFWGNSGELVCEQRANGKNCWWKESNPAADKYSQIQTEYYNLYSKVKQGEDTENLELQLMQHKIIKLIEETSVLLNRIKSDDFRSEIFYEKLDLQLNILKLELTLFASTVQTLDQHWSSRGPEYISAEKKDYQKAQCLYSYIISAIEVKNSLKISILDSGFVSCGFVRKKI